MAQDKKPIEVPKPDFTQFTEKNSKSPEIKKPKLVANAIRWWACDKAELPYAVMQQVANIIRADKGRIESYNTYAKLYGTYTPTFWNGYQLANSGKPTAPLRDRLTYNIIQSCIDTLTSRVAQNKPKPMFLTQAGDSKLQRKAKKLDAFCYGLFYQNRVYEQAPKIFRDACVYGEGIYHAYDDGGQIKYERVLPYEILVDYLESHYGPESTKSLFRIKNIDRTQLIEAWPEFKEQILAMNSTATYISASQRSVSDTVTIVEAWRLPVGTTEGRHVIVGENVTLCDESYDQDFFPFAILRYSPRLYGFYAQGMAEQLVPTQIEINRTLISIQRTLYLGGTFKIFLPAGSKVIKSHFDNLVGTIIQYAGQTPPQYVVPQLVQPEIYSHLENMKQSGYQLSGVSQMAASSVKPMGLNSGKALRAYDDIQVERFQTVAQMYEQFFVDMARITIPVARKIYEDHGSLEVKVPGKRFIQTIDWSDVDMEDDKFQLQVYPVSKLPNDPEGRLATIQEMMQAGLITPEAGKRLLDYPDLEAEENLSNATMDYIHTILDKMIDDGEYTAPEPFDDLNQCRRIALEYYASGKLNNMKEERLELIRRFLTQIDLLQQMAVPPAPAVGSIPAAPMANPMPSPVNELIPNVPAAVGP